MFKIIRKENLAENTKLGQFVVLRIDEKGERIPLTIADFDRNRGDNYYCCAGSWKNNVSTW